METPPPRWVGRRCKLLLPPAEGLLPPLRVKEVKVAAQRRGWKVAGGNRRGPSPGAWTAKRQQAAKAPEKLVPGGRCSAVLR